MVRRYLDPVLKFRSRVGYLCLAKGEFSLDTIYTFLQTMPTYLLNAKKNGTLIEMILHGNYLFGFGKEDIEV